MNSIIIILFYMSSIEPCSVNCNSRSFLRLLENFHVNILKQLEICIGSSQQEQLEFWRPGPVTVWEAAGIVEEVVWKISHAKSICSHLLLLLLLLLLQMKDVEGRRGARVFQCGRWGYRPGSNMTEQEGVFIPGSSLQQVHGCSWSCLLNLLDET